MSRKLRPCAACPLRDANGWCPHLATTRPPNAPSCEWGRKKMNAEHSAEYMRRKFGWTKRAPKAPPQEANRETAEHPHRGGRLEYKYPEGKRSEEDAYS